MRVLEGGTRYKYKRIVTSKSTCKIYRKKRQCRRGHGRKLNDEKLAGLHDHDRAPECEQERLRHPTPPVQVQRFVRDHAHGRER